MRPLQKNIDKRVKFGEFGRLVLAVIPLVVLGMYMGMQEVGLIPSLKVSNAAEASMCKSWESVRINDCGSDEFGSLPRDAKCISRTNEVELKLNPPLEAKKIMWAEVDAETSCNQLGQADWNLSEIKHRSVTASLEKNKIGERKICVYYIGDNGLSNKCGAMIDYQPVVPTSLSCDSWESVRIERCSLNDWNSAKRPNRCVTNKEKVAVRLKSPGAVYYRYAFVPVSQNCSTVNLDGYRLNSINDNQISIDNREEQGERKVCVQFLNNSAKSPVCGAQIQYLK